MISVEVDGAVGRVTLENPEKRNAMSDAFIAEMTRIVSALDDDDEVRVVVIAAHGPVFCAGGDLNWMAKAADYGAADNIADIRKLGEMLRAVDELTKPVIARVQGPAYGGGVGLMCCCDIVVAVPEARFSLSETRLGLVPGVISPFVVGALGPRTARRLVLTGELFDIDMAVHIGLVHEVRAERDLDAEIDRLTREILKGGPRAVAGAKALLRGVLGRRVNDELLTETAQIIAEVRGGAEAREGVSAFLEKRPAAWVPNDDDKGSR